jgi:hypothetical protein
VSNGRRAWIAAAALLLLASGRAGAHVLFDRTTLRQWTAEADATVVAEFTSGAQMWRAEDGSDRQEFFRVRVADVLEGAIEAGTTLDYFPHAEGFPRFRAGDRALLFLEHSADHPEFASLAPRFAWFSTQGAGQEWRLAPGPEGAAVEEIARRLAAYRSARPSDPRGALRDLLLAELASGVPRLRSDAITELIRMRAWPGFLDAASTPGFAAWTESAALSATERLALVRVLEGAPGFDADARLRAMTQEPLAGAELAQLVRAAGARGDPALRVWLTTLVEDPRPAVRREAQAALTVRR